MSKRKRADDSLDEATLCLVALKDFRKNVYPLLYQHAYAAQPDENLMEYHICLACHPSGTLELRTMTTLPKYLYKCPTSIEVNGDLSFGRGHQNLLKHYNNQHKGWRGLVVAAYEKGETQLKMDKFLNKDATITNQWMELVIENNLPITYVEKKGFNKFIKIQDTINYKTFLKRMKIVTEYIEELMRKRLARYLFCLIKSVKRFGLMIDGWSSNYTHYLAVFIVTKEYGTELLSFSPLNRRCGSHKK